MPRQGLFFVYAAHFLRPLCGDSACLFCSPRTEHLLIYRIQSHTHPKRRKFCLKHAGQKSVKDKLPEQRKGPKRAAECRLKVPTHVWEQDAVGSNPATRTTSEQSPLCSDVFLCLWQKMTSSARSLAPPLQIEPADAGLRFGFSFSTVSSPIITLRPNPSAQAEGLFIVLGTEMRTGRRTTVYNELFISPRDHSFTKNKCLSRYSTVNHFIGAVKSNAQICLQTLAE